METLIEPVVFALVPVVIGLVQALKETGLKSKHAPLVSIILGMSLSTLVVDGFSGVILGGIVVGLASSGLYSGTRAVVGK